MASQTEQSSQSSQSYVTDMVNSDIQYRTNNNETIEQTNTRIRASICVNFNKILMSRSRQQS